MIGEEYIIEIYFTSLILTEKKSLGVIDRIEKEACKI